MRRALAMFAVLMAACGLGRDAAPARGPLHGIVVVGDSLAHGAGDESGRGIAGWLREMTNDDVTNLGINGARTANVLHVLRRADVRRQVRHARTIVLSVGGNDLFGNSIERLRSVAAPELTIRLVSLRVVRVVNAIHRENPAAKIILLGLFNPYRPTKLGPWLDTEVSRWDSRVIGLFAATHAVTVVRIADLLDEKAAISPLDHYHPSAAGYRAVAERIKTAL